MVSMSTTQVAVRMEPELVELLDWLVVRGPFENRADVIRQALVEMGRRERDRATDDAIAAGYGRLPASAPVSTPDFTVWNQLDDEEWGQW
jgi:Arc/MetJ-type ribon-helix-helix transcriptional regulator